MIYCPTSPIDIISKYYAKDSDIYYILWIHSEQVKDKAIEIATKHPELKADLRFLEEAAMLHDIGIFLCNAHGIHCRGEHHYIEHGYLGAEILRGEGLPDHALVCERHTGTGLSREMIQKQKLPLPDRDMQPVNIEEQIICYADKFFSKTNLSKPHSIDKIRKDLARFGQENLDIFDGWHKLFEV